MLKLRREIVTIRRLIRELPVGERRIVTFGEYLLELRTETPMRSA